MTAGWATLISMENADANEGDNNADTNASEDAALAGALREAWPGDE